ncbi:MAG TPA: hypothetical protein VGN44_12390 [Candidatus Angelobacter sp.]
MKLWEILLPLIRFSSGLKHLIALLQKVVQMFFEHQSIHDTSEERNRSAKLKLIDHQRAAVFLFECVIMLEIAEKAFHHGVLKIRGAVKGRDPYAHFQPESKMASTPFNFFA